MIIINLLPVRKGGGLQNALSLLGTIPVGTRCMVAFRHNSKIVESISRSGFRSEAARDTLFSRLRSEVALRRESTNNNIVCFTLFGPPPIFSKGRVINVVGCAYSNLFYPEIDFWRGFGRVARFYKGAIDLYRRWSIGKADYWIFETEVLARRAVEVFSFPANRVFVVRMAPSPVAINRKGDSKFIGLEGDVFNVLYLTGFHKNKRIESLIEVARIVKEEGRIRCKFILTLDDRVKDVMDILFRINDLGLSDYFLNLGPISPDRVGELIDQCDAMCNLARLESFSNNFVEAWSLKRPLLVTDADWSRDSCGEGAVYVNPCDPRSIVDAIDMLSRNDDVYRSVVESGDKVLGTYPDAKKKTEEYFDILKRKDLSVFRGPNVWMRKR